MNKQKKKVKKMNSEENNISLALLKNRKRDIMVIVGCVLFVLLVGIFFTQKGNFNLTNNRTNTKLAVSDKVSDYEPLIVQYASEHQIPEYVQVIKAIMQQESGGRGLDVMQCSECFMNTKYEREPGGIEDAEYSIDVGIQYFAHCLELSECTGPDDMKRLKLALQGYNYGHNYIRWAKENFGGYTKVNAKKFSDLMKNEYGWEVYGDPDYTEHVLRYYNEE